MPLHQKKFELCPRLKLGVGRGYSQNKIFKIASGISLAVAAILSVNAVRLVMGSHSQTSASPQVLGAEDVNISKNSDDLQFTIYTVQKGDTLFNISQKFSISWNTLATLNNLKSPYYLKPGQTIKVPKPYK